MIVRRSLCALLLVATLSGAACGIKGPLRLPPPKADASAPSAAPPTPPAAAPIDPAGGRSATEPGASPEPKK